MREEDIRKHKVFDKYLELVKNDVDAFFDFSGFLDVGCPACLGRESSFQFKKYGFAHVLCSKCSTLFVNPRPALKVIEKFYAESPSTSFWVKEFFKPMADSRRVHIFKPRAEYVSSMLPSRGALTVGDVGAGFGIFLEEIRRIRPSNRYVAIEPSVEMAQICRKAGLETRPVIFEDIDVDDRYDLLTSFELMEHLFSPEVFLRKAYSLLKPGGKLVVTTLNSQGFDISSLWERSKSVTPPHHLNYFNTGSIGLLFGRVGFRVQEISTPGKLDWDIVNGMIIREGADLGRFWRSLAENGSEECKHAFQEWLVKNNLSSHMRVVAVKE